MNDTKQVVHLLSGGIDSVLGYYYMIENTHDIDPHNVICIHYGMGVGYSKFEKQCVTKLRHDHIMLPIHIYDNPCVNYMSMYEKSDSFIPYRNMQMAIFAALQHSDCCDVISFGSLQTDNVGDGSRSFRNSLSDVMSMSSGGDKIEVKSYIDNLSKDELMRSMFTNEFFNNMLKRKKLTYLEFITNYTHSCYSNQKEKCMACKACFRYAVSLNSIFGEFIPFNDERIITDYYSRFMKDCNSRDHINISEYERIISSLNYINKHKIIDDINKCAKYQYISDVIKSKINNMECQDNDI